MKLSDLEPLLTCRVIVRGQKYPDGEFSEVVASDMMSEILVIDQENFLIITSLTSDQVVRTANLVGSPAILLVNGKVPMPSMQKLAEENGLTVLSTEQSCFRVCAELGKILLPERMS